jgi:hypothetical protein
MSTIKPGVAERFAQHVPYHRPRTEIERAAAALGSSPTENGVIEMIICRPARYERMVLDAGVLEVAHGLLGDTWEARGATNTPDGRANPLRQVTVMNSRALASVAGERERWELAGDQFIVDLDLSMANLPAGTRLQIGEAVAEVTEPPHTGCAKFAGRYGVDALAWVSDRAGRQRRRRGMHVWVLRSGTVRPGDSIRKLDAGG